MLTAKIIQKTEMLLAKNQKIQLYSYKAKQVGQIGFKFDGFELKKGMDCELLR